jgi:photosystem II stability/assembly factor-like uncharacterized protein
MDDVILTHNTVSKGGTIKPTQLNLDVLTKTFPRLINRGEPIYVDNANIAVNPDTVGGTIVFVGYTINTFTMPHVPNIGNGYTLQNNTPNIITITGIERYSDLYPNDIMHARWNGHEWDFITTIPNFSKFVYGNTLKQGEDILDIRNGLTIMQETTRDMLGHAWHESNGHMVDCQTDAAACATQFNGSFGEPFFTKNGTILIGGIDNVICRSTDNGITWTRTPASEYMKSMFVYPEDEYVENYWFFKFTECCDGTIIATGMMGIIYSVDNGKTWEPSNINYGSFYDAGQLVTTGRIFIHCHTSVNPSNKGLYYSDNSGRTWQKYQFDIIANDRIKQLYSFRTVIPPPVFAHFTYSEISHMLVGYNIERSSDAGIYYSYDGIQFTAAHITFGDWSGALYLGDNKVIASSKYPTHAGAYYSMDGGITWYKFVINDAIRPGSFIDATGLHFMHDIHMDFDAFVQLKSGALYARGRNDGFYYYTNLEWKNLALKYPAIRHSKIRFMQGHTTFDKLIIIANDTNQAYSVEADVIKEISHPIDYTAYITPIPTPYIKNEHFISVARNVTSDSDTCDAYSYDHEIYWSSVLDDAIYNYTIVGELANGGLLLQDTDRTIYITYDGGKTINTLSTGVTSSVAIAPDGTGFFIKGTNLYHITASGAVVLHISQLFNASAIYSFVVISPDNINIMVDDGIETFLATQTGDAAGTIARSATLIRCISAVQLTSDSYIAYDMNANRITKWTFATWLAGTHTWYQVASLNAILNDMQFYVFGETVYAVSNIVSRGIWKSTMNSLDTWTQMVITGIYSTMIQDAHETVYAIAGDAATYMAHIGISHTEWTISMTAHGPIIPVIVRNNIVYFVNTIVGTLYMTAIPMIHTKPAPVVTITPDSHHTPNCLKLSYDGGISWSNIAIAGSLSQGNVVVGEMVNGGILLQDNINSLYTTYNGGKTIDMICTGLSSLAAIAPDGTGFFIKGTDLYHIDANGSIVPYICQLFNPDKIYIFIAISNDNTQFMVDDSDTTMVVVRHEDDLITTHSHDDARYTKAVKIYRDTYLSYNEYSQQFNIWEFGSWVANLYYKYAINTELRFDRVKIYIIGDTVYCTDPYLHFGVWKSSLMDIGTWEQDIMSGAYSNIIQDMHGTSYAIPNDENTYIAHLPKGATEWIISATACGPMMPIVGNNNVIYFINTITYDVVELTASGEFVYTSMLNNIPTLDGDIIDVVQLTTNNVAILYDLLDGHAGMRIASIAHTINVTKFTPIRIHYQYLIGGTTHDGIQYSTNNGLTWHPSSIDTGYYYTPRLLSNGLLVAGSKHNGIVYSYDDGVSWHHSSLWHNGYNTPIELANGKLITSGDNAGFMLSTDFGKSWDATNVYTGYYDTPFHSNYTDRYYAASHKLGLFQSHDGCDTWFEEIFFHDKLIHTPVVTNRGTLITGSKTNEGIFYRLLHGEWLPSNMLDGSWKIKILSMNNIEYIFALSTVNKGIMYSDTGVTWKPIVLENNAYITEGSYTDVVCFHNSMLIVFGTTIVYTTDIINGCWSECGGPTVDSLESPLISDDNWIIIGSTKGYYISIDGGQNWISQDIINGYSYSPTDTDKLFPIMQTHSNILITGASFSPAISYNQGITWCNIPYFANKALPVLGNSIKILADSETPYISSMYRCTTSNTFVLCIDERVIVYSTDNCKSYHATNVFKHGTKIKLMADISTDDFIIALFDEREFNLGYSFMYSINSGKSWHYPPSLPNAYKAYVPHFDKMIKFDTTKYMVSLTCEDTGMVATLLFNKTDTRFLMIYPQANVEMLETSYITELSNKGLIRYNSTIYDSAVYGKVYYSSDEGASWHDVITLPITSQIKQILKLKNNFVIIVIKIPNLHDMYNVYSSADGGRTWAYTGIQGDDVVLYATGDTNAVAFISANNDDLNVTQIRYTDNGGLSWNTANLITDDPISTPYYHNGKAQIIRFKSNTLFYIEHHPSTSTTYGVYSNDNGRIWRAMPITNYPITNAKSILLADNSMVIYDIDIPDFIDGSVLPYSALLRSVNDGISWTVYPAYDALHDTGLVFHKHYDQMCFDAYDEPGTAIIVTNNQDMVTNSTIALFDTNKVYIPNKTLAMIYNPTYFTPTICSDGTLIMSSYDNCSEYYSQDNGKSWMEHGTLDKRCFIDEHYTPTVDTALIPHDTFNGRSNYRCRTALYIKDNEYLIALYGRGLEFSINNGISWRSAFLYNTETNSKEYIDTGTYDSFTLLSTGRIIAGCAESHVLYSDNKGVSWFKSLLAGFSAPLETTNNVLIASSLTNTGIMYSLDFGHSWRYSNIVAGTFTKAVELYTGALVIASLSGDGIFKSIDEGKTWVRTTIYEGSFKTPLILNNGCLATTEINGKGHIITSRIPYSTL